MSEKRMTRSSASTVSAIALNNHHHRHNHHNYHDHNHHRNVSPPPSQPSSHQSNGDVVLVRESKILRSDKFTKPVAGTGVGTTTTTTTTTAAESQHKRKLTAADADALIDVEFDSRRSSPASGQHVALMTSPVCLSNQADNRNSSPPEKTRKAAAVAPSLRHSSRLLRNSSSNQDMTQGGLSSSSSLSHQQPHQDDNASVANTREKRKTRMSVEQRPKRMAPTLIADEDDDDHDETIEQAYLNSSITLSTSSSDNTSDKIVTRRQSTNMLINQLKAGINGSRKALLDHSFQAFNKRRIPTHPLGLTQSLKLQNQPELGGAAATNLENLIDQSSSCSSLASSSAASTKATTTMPTNHQRSNKSTSALKELNNTANKKQQQQQRGGQQQQQKGTATTATRTATALPFSSKLRRTSRLQLKKEDVAENHVFESQLFSPSLASATSATSVYTGEDTKAAVATAAAINALQCPVQRCNSDGCLDGRAEAHCSYDKCPVYFGMTADECRRRKTDLEKRMREIKDKLAKINDGKKMLRNKKLSQEQCEYYAKLLKELKKQLPSTTAETNAGARFSASSSLSSQHHHHMFPETTPELLGDIKNLSTSFIITTITNSFAPTPMPHFMATGGFRVPPPTSLASNSALLLHHNARPSLSSSYSSTSAPGESASHHKSASAAQAPPVSSFLNRIMPNAPLPPVINDLNVSPLELDFFRDVLVAGMAENIPPESRRPLKKLREDSKIVQLGNWEIETWYKSPYPDDYWQLDKIFLCQFCLQYMKSHTVLSRHLEKCVWRHPPGREIYRKNLLSFFEVDGKFNKIYCQNLCLLAKLFLDHKTLYFDVEPFLFYILTRYNDTTGSFEMIGYFSKEKQSIMNYNLSCILILPQFMNQGYGRLLIDFSYLLSRVEGKLGSPERPLSDLGLLSYRSYWKAKVLAYLAQHLDDAEILVKDISAETGILSNDIISTLQYIGLVKYWKGKHVILKDRELIEQLQKRKYSSSSSSYHHEMDVDPSCLKWSPYVYQTIISEYESSPPSTPFYSSTTSTHHSHHRTGRQASDSYD